MTLKIYPDTTSNNPYSQGGGMTNPLRESFDGRNGGVKETKYYLRNDDSAYQYSSITLTPLDQAGRSIVGGVDGYSWKLRVGDTQPTADEWETISHGNSISFSDISGSSTYLPFWIRIEIPKGAPIESHEDVVLRISANETLIAAV